MPKVVAVPWRFDNLLLGGVLNALDGRLFVMQSATDQNNTVLIAPERLIAATRGAFRTAALDHLDSFVGESGVIVIDMQNTVELDASGLGILVLVQKRAKDRGLSTRLRQTPERVRNLLKLTMLDFLFELTD